MKLKLGLIALVIFICGASALRAQYGSSMLGLSQAFAYVADELRRQYSLGYYPKAATQAQGERRQIRVRVNRPDLAVRARNEYVFGPSADKR